MLTVRTEQIEALRKAREAEYCKRLRHYMRSDHPDAVGHMTDDELNRYIEEALAFAASNRIKSGDGVLLLAILSVVSGGKFCKDSAVENFFRIHHPDSEAKIRWLTQLVTKRLHSESNAPTDFRFR